MYAQHPMLLDKKHPLTMLIVTDAHLHVLHNGVRETLSQLRSEYWLVKGQQFIHEILHSCVICNKQEGKVYRGNPPLPLPEY